MQPSSRRAALVLLAIGATVALNACRSRSERHSEIAPAKSERKPEASASTAKKTSRLSEDPILAKKSTAQWKEHLEEEERHRRLCYDRDRLKLHEKAVSSIGKLRQRYDRANTKAAVKTAKTIFTQRLAGIEKQILAIDRWRNSSRVLEDYDAMLAVLSEPYPAALLASLGGDAEALGKLRIELDQHEEKIRKSLAEAAACENE